MQIGPLNNPTPIQTPARLPDNVSRLSGVVHDQVESFLVGQQADAQALRSSLRQLTTQARDLRPLNLVTNEQKQKAKDVAHLHGLACRIAAYTTFVAGQLPAGMTMAAAQAHLKTMQGDFDATVGKVFASGEVQSVSLGGIPPRPDLIPTVEVPAGSFKMGYDNKEVHLDGYRMSKYPVTNQQYLEFVQSTGYQSEGSFLPPKGGAYGEGPDSPANHPAPMTYYDLKAFAEWVGGTIPTREQWEKAARGTDGNKYPWGNDWRPDLCNHDSGGTTPVNQFEKAGNVSPFGAVDMVGNMLEWVDGGADRRPGATFLKGGAWTNYLGEDLNNSAFDCIRETSETPDSRYLGFGGRVAFPLKSSAQTQSASLSDTFQLSPGTNLAGMAGTDNLAAQTWLQPVKTEVESLLAHPGQATAKPLRTLLQEICAQVREQRPLTSAEQDGAVKSKIDNLMQSANRMAYYASFVASGSPPVGITLAQCGEELQKSLQGLQSSGVPLQETAAVQKVQSSADNPAGLEWVEIPAGSFKFGRDGKEVHLDAYRMAKYPITNGQFTKFMKATGYQPEGGFHPPKEGYPAGEDSPGNHPVGNVSFYDLQAFARWAAPGGRVPNEMQWEKAARGDNGQQFPWGNDLDPEKINHDSGGTISVYESERRGNVSPYGVVDTVGNCLEWVDNSTAGRPGSTMLKGGAYSNSANAMKVQSTTRFTTDLPNTSYGGFGGRICAPA